MEKKKNGHLLICMFKRKEVMKKYESFDKFQNCFEGVGDLEEEKKKIEGKRKKKIGKE